MLQTFVCNRSAIAALLIGAATAATAAQTAAQTDLLAIDYRGSAVRRFDPLTGALLGDLVNDPLITFAHGFAIAPKGHAQEGEIFVSDEGGIIHRFDPSGVFIDFLTSNGDVFDNIAFADDGTLLASSYATEEVERYDALTGDFLGAFTSGGGMITPNGFAFGPDGNFYVASEETHTVKRFDGMTGAFMDDFATGGGLNLPVSICFGPDENLYVASIGTNSVLRYDGSTGAFIDTFAANPVLAFVVSAHFGTDGDLYVGGVNNAQLQRFDGQTGAYIGPFTEAGALDGITYFMFPEEAGCYPDCTGEGTLDIFDFLCFQDAFVQGEPYANCDGNAAFDIFDFLCFQDAFVIGCP